MFRTKSVLLFLCLAGSFPTIAQTGTDTLVLAKDYVYKKDFAAADALLSTYQQGHPDQYTLQLHAQVCYWMQDFGRAAALYWQAIQRFPDYAALKLDFGRFLFEQGHKKAAEAQLLAYRATDALNAEANLNLGYLALWKGNVTEARGIASKLEKAYPGSAAAASLNRYIRENSAPYIRAGYEYLSDDQPVQAKGFNLEAGMYRSAAFAPYIAVATTQFETQQQPATTLLMKLGNNFRLGYGSTVINAEGGLFCGGSNHPSFTGSLDINQKLTNSLRLLLSAGVLPYQYTSASITQPFNYGQYGAALDMNLKESFLGKAGIEAFSFGDGNTIGTAYGWFLLPVVHRKWLQLKTGYSLSVANAPANTFTSTQPLSKIATSQAPNTQVAGIYTPYFTPRQQQVHAVLASLQLKISKAVQFNARGSYGLKARAENPILMLEINQRNQYTLNKYYYQQDYTPFEAEASLQLSFSPHLALHTKYNHSTLLFYSRNYASLQLNYRFSYEKYK